MLHTVTKVEEIGANGEKMEAAVRLEFHFIL